MTYKEIAESLGLTPEALDEILWQYPFAEDRPAPKDAVVTDEMRGRINKQIEDQDLRESVKKLDEAIAFSREFFMKQYQDFVVEEQETYIPKIRELLDRLSGRMQPGESVTDLIRRERLTPTLTPNVAISVYGVQDDKVNNDMLRISPGKRDVDGQISFLWSVNKASEKSNPVPVYVSTTYEGPEIQTSKRLTVFDFAVMDAISTMIHHWRLRGIQPPYTTTPKEIWRTMNGLAGTDKDPTENQTQRILQSIDKMRFTRLRVDITSEYIAHKLVIDDERVVVRRTSDDQIEEVSIDDYYLNISYADAFTRTRKLVKTSIRINMDPFMYLYNLATNNIEFFDYNLLDTSDTTGNEGETSTIRRHLMQQIKLMYRGKRNHKISYASLYDAAGIRTPEERADEKSSYKNDSSRAAVIRRYAKDDRDKVKAILQSWKNKEWILDYEETKRGRILDGVSIKLNPKNFKDEEPQNAIEDKGQ